MTRSLYSHLVLAMRPSATGMDHRQYGNNPSFLHFRVTEGFGDDPSRTGKIEQAESGNALRPADVKPEKHRELIDGALATPKEQILFLLILSGPGQLHAYQYKALASDNTSAVIFHQ